MNAQTDRVTDEPSVAGVRVRPVWSMVLYALLVSSAALALWVQRNPAVPEPLARWAPWLFLAFALGFTVYRLALVLSKRYSAFKAFFQIFMAALFFLLLLLPAVELPRPGGATGTASLAAQLRAGDAQVRALAAEVAGWRGEAGQAPGLVALLEDPAAEVRAAAHGALVRLNGGADLGPADDAGARRAWRDRFP